MEIAKGKSKQSLNGGRKKPRTSFAVQKYICYFLS